MTAIPTRFIFLASRELQARAAVLQAENDRMEKVFGERAPTNVKHECSERAEQIEAFTTVAAKLVELDATIGAES